MKKSAYSKKFKELLTSMNSYRPEFDFFIDQLAEICEYRDHNRQCWKEECDLAPTIERLNARGECVGLGTNPFYTQDLKYNDLILKYIKDLGLSPRSAKDLGTSLSEEVDDLQDYEM